METNPFNPIVRRRVGRAWNEDVLPVMDWEAPQHRVVLPASLQLALELDTSVLRWSAEKRNRMLQARPQIRDRVERIGDLIAEWVAAGLEPDDRGGWHVVFRDGHHLNDMVFGKDQTGSWNVITMYPLRGRQRARIDADWMIKRQDE